MSNFIISLLNLLVLLVGAIFTYYRFFREGSHNQRIELDLECIDLGINGKYRIVEVAITAINKGNVEQKFDDIRLKIHGIVNGQELKDIKNHSPRLRFSEEKPSISVIPEKYKYFFVRPSVKQRFPVVLKIPANWSQLQTRSTFKYLGTNEIHSAERAFKLVNEKNG
jgi:hypothetical protein